MHRPVQSATDSQPHADPRAKGWYAAALLGVLAVGICVRVGLITWFQGEPIRVVDAQHYNQLAVSLATTGDFAHADGVLTSHRPPLYPLFVSAIYRLFGVDNHHAVRIAQAVLGLVSTLLVYRIARVQYSQPVGVVAAAAVCLYPSLVGFECLLLTETLFTFLLLLGALCLQSYFTRQRGWWLVGLGVCLGLGALTRSVLWLFPPFLVVYLLLVGGRSWKNRLLAAALPVVAMAMVILPWSIRNTRLQRVFTAVDDIGGRNFMMGNYEHTPRTRIWDAISIKGERAWYSVLIAKTPEYHSLTQGQRDKLALRYGLNYVVNHPGETAARDVQKFFDFWQLERTLAAGMARGWWKTPPRVATLLTLLICGSYCVAMIAGIFGYLVAPPVDRRLHVFLLLLTAFVCAVHTAVFGHSRYHLSLMPFILISAASGLVDYHRIWHSRGKWAFWLAALICGILVASWGWELASQDGQHLELPSAHD